MAKNEFFQIKDNLGSFNFKNHKKIHPPPQFTSPRPRHATHEARERYFSFCKKNPPLKKEREGTEGERGKKNPGTQKAPSIASKPQRQKIRKKNTCQKIFRHLDRSVMLLAVNYFVFPTIGRSRFCVPFRNINLILAEKSHLFSTAS